MTAGSRKTKNHSPKNILMRSFHWVPNNKRVGLISPLGHILKDEKSSFFFCGKWQPDQRKRRKHFSSCWKSSQLQPTAIKSLKPVSFASGLEKAHLYHLLSSGRRASSHSVHVQFPGSEVAWRPRPTGLNSVRWRTRLGKGVVSQTNGGKNPNSRGGNRTARSTVETQTNGTSLPQFVRIVMRKPN